MTRERQRLQTAAHRITDRPLGNRRKISTNRWSGTMDMNLEAAEFTGGRCFFLPLHLLRPLLHFTKAKFADDDGDDDKSLG